MKNIYEKFNFTQKYKNQLTDFLKINTTIESGGTC